MPSSFSMPGECSLVAAEGSSDGELGPADLLAAKEVAHRLRWRQAGSRGWVRSEVSWILRFWFQASADESVAVFSQPRRNPCQPVEAGRRSVARYLAYSALGLELGCLVRNLAGVIQDLPIGESQEVVQLRDPIGHVHGFPVPRLKFGKFQVGVDDPVERLEFLGLEVVLGDSDVVLRTTPPGRRGQAHERLRGVGPLVDDLRGRVSVRRPVHLVLHGGEELLRHFRLADRSPRSSRRYRAPFGRRRRSRRADVADASSNSSK